MHCIVLNFRNVNDLSYALSPYRGQNWFMYHGNGDPRNGPVGKVSCIKLVYVSWEWRS